MYWTELAICRFPPCDQILMKGNFKSIWTPARNWKQDWGETLFNSNVIYSEKCNRYIEQGCPELCHNHWFNLTLIYITLLNNIMLHCIEFLYLHYKLHYVCITMHWSCTGVALRMKNQKMPGVVWWWWWCGFITDNNSTLGLHWG